MSPSRISLSFLFLFAIFTVQEAAISRISFPITGFSLFLAVLIGLMALEDRSGAIALGFIGGLIMDLSPTANTPFGQWALVLTLVGYVIGSNRESIGDFTTRPFRIARPQDFARKRKDRTTPAGHQLFL